MPGTRCTVAVCNNSFAKTKKAGLNIMYHQFPKTQPLRDIWIEKCRRAGKWNPNSCHVCSIHFTEEDYRRDPTYELYDIPKKRRLKSTAVPSLFLTESPPCEFESSQGQRKRKKHSVDEELPLYLDSDSDETIYLPIDNVNNEDDSSNTAKYEICETEDSNESVLYVSDYNSSHTEITSVEELEAYYEKENEEIEEINQQYPEFSKLECITMRHQSTQTNSDYFLQNYKQLEEKNAHLESELIRWSNKYQNLMSNMKLLESNIERLKLNSKQT